MRRCRAFRAGLHGGTVTAGELGDLRRQIVFVGDILDTAVELPPGVEARRCGELDLRGKEAPVAAYSLSG